MNPLEKVTAGMAAEKKVIVTPCLLYTSDAADD